MISKHSIYIVLMILSTQSYVFAMEDDTQMSQLEMTVLGCMKGFIGQRANGGDADWSLLALKNKDELTSLHYNDIINIMSSSALFKNFTVFTQKDRVDSDFSTILSDEHIGKVLCELSIYLNKHILYDCNFQELQDDKKQDFIDKLLKLAIERYAKVSEKYIAENKSNKLLVRKNEELAADVTKYKKGSVVLILLSLGLVSYILKINYF